MTTMMRYARSEWIECVRVSERLSESSSTVYVLKADYNAYWEVSESRRIKEGGKDEEE